MPRTSKFFFAFSNRKPSVEKTHFPKERAGGDENSSGSTITPGSKLERLLGTQGSNTFESTQEKKALGTRRSRQSSYASAVVSSEDTDPVRSHNETNDSSLEPPRPTQHLRPQASSPLLGKHFFEDLADWGNLTDASSTRLHPSESSSTLRSYYDAAKTPLSVSQQTSASSARDMALRKGHTPIAGSSPLSMEVSKDGDGRKDMGLSASPTRITATKRRPPRLEISALFPKPHLWNRPMLSPQRVVSSPSTLSPSIAVHQSAGAKLSRAKSSTIGQQNPRPPPPYEYHMQYPVTLESGALEKELGAIDLEEPVDEGGYYQPHDFFYYEAMKSRNLEVKDRAIYTQCNDVALQGAISEKRREQQSRMPQTVNHQPRTPVARSSVVSSYQSSLSEKVSNLDRSSNLQSAPSVVSSLRSFGRGDPHLESFLELSSSDEEGEEVIYPSRRIRRQIIRDSIEREDKGDEPLLCSAQILKPLKPPPIINISLHRNGRASSNPVSRSRTTPSSHLPHEVTHGQRISSINRQQSKHSATTPTNSIHRVSSTSCKSTSRRSPQPQSPVDPLSKPTTPARKLMAVTQEEEELLEAMRRKRASMHQATPTGPTPLTCSNFISLPPRPKTAEAKDRRSPSLESDLSNFPFPPDHGLIGLRHSSHAFSSNDLPTQGTFPFPSRSASQAQRRPISNMSQTLSFTPSDLLLSENTSQSSLLTPLDGRGTDSPTLWKDSPVPWSGREEWRKEGVGLVVEEKAFKEVDEITEWAAGRLVR